MNEWKSIYTRRDIPDGVFRRRARTRRRPSTRSIRRLVDDADGIVDVVAVDRWTRSRARRARESTTRWIHASRARRRADDEKDDDVDDARDGLDDDDRGRDERREKRKVGDARAATRATRTMARVTVRGVGGEGERERTGKAHDGVSIDRRARERDRVRDARGETRSGDVSRGRSRGGAGEVVHGAVGSIEDHHANRRGVEGERGERGGGG